MLKSVDILIGFSVIMLVVSMSVTLIIQWIMHFLGMRGKELLKGLSLTVTPSEASALSVTMLGSARTATAAALKYNLTLASASRKLAGGAQKFRLRASRRLIGYRWRTAA